MSNRVSTGASGLDDLIEGGLLNNSTVLVTGGPGTGKTLLATQYMWHGLQQGETVLYISTEELPAEIVHDAERFGWDLDEDSDRFEIRYVDPATRSEYFRRDVEDLVKEMGPDRIVIDSLSVLGYYWEDEQDVRSNITQLMHKLKEWGATTVVTAESPDSDESGSTRHEIAEFVSDGVIQLDMSTLGEDVERTIQVSKMRGTDLDAGEYSFAFTEDGIELS